VLPASIWLAKEDRKAGSLRAVRRVEGMAVVRTERTESAEFGRSKLSVAKSEARDALNGY
jgi:hypothetical protein